MSKVILIHIKNQKDADNLLSAASGFHDDTIKSISYELSENYNDPSCVRVLFTECLDCDIVLEFKKDVLIYFNYEDNVLHNIMGSNILFHKRFVYLIYACIDGVCR